MVLTGFYWFPLQCPAADGVSASGAAVQQDQSDGEDKENQPEAEGAEEDDGGWITPSNIGQLKLDSPDWTAAADVTVGCVTTDFAMQVRRVAAGTPRARPDGLLCSFQNVLVQIGLHVLSLDGMLIRQARNYILRCHACFRWAPPQQQLLIQPHPT